MTFAGGAMKLIRSWWVEMRSRRRTAALGLVDFGDMGTAFGLDACLEQQSWDLEVSGACVSPDLEVSLPSDGASWHGRLRQ